MSRIQLHFFSSILSTQCQDYTPVITAIADELQVPLMVSVKEEDPDNAFGRYNIRGVPVVMITGNGKMLWQSSGIVDRLDLLQIITELNDKGVTT